MSVFFKPYEGKRPYLFVSYSHKDSAIVLDTIELLHRQYYRLWYDEGIPPGSDWPRNIEMHLSSCGMVLFFLSANSMASPNCFSEIKTAADQGKPMLLLRLDDAAVDQDWSSVLSRVTLIPNAETAPKRAENIIVCPALTREYLGSAAEYRTQSRGKVKRSGWTAGIVLAGLFLAASVAGVYGLATGRFAPLFEQPTTVAPETTTIPEETTTVIEEETTTAAVEVDMSRYGDLFGSLTNIEFPDKTQEKAIRLALGIQSGDIPKEKLLNIQSLYFCGNLVKKNMDHVILDENGTLTVNGSLATQGEVSDLSLIGSMPYLEELALICQPVEDLSGLSGLTLLRELSLAGSNVSDLSGLEDLPSLQTLHLEHSGVRDLTPLSGLPGLRTVTVSADMIPLIMNADIKADVVLVR